MDDGQMDRDWERMAVGVRADTAGFARDVETMRAALEEQLAAGADRAGRAIETTLARAVRTGKLGFQDLRNVALSAMGEIAAGALQAGIGSLIGGSGGIGGGGGIASALIAALGAPGRATGGPVSPGRPFWVGERGPELFVPTAAGTVMPAGSRGGRDVRVTINVTTPADAAPAALARSSRQVARAVKAALAGVED